MGEKLFSLELHISTLNIKHSEPLASKFKPAPSRFIFNNDNKSSYLEMQKDNNRINDFSRPNLLKHILACHVFTYEVKYFQHQLSER